MSDIINIGESSSDHDTNESTTIITCFKDEYFTKPIIVLNDDDTFGTIRRIWFDSNLVCTLNGTSLMYIDVTNSWRNLADNQTMIRVNAIVGASAAVVNFHIAFSPYREFIERNCRLRPARTPPTSINISTLRLEISVGDNKDVLLFKPCNGLVDVDGTLNCFDTLSTVCYLPLSYNTIPETYYYPGNGVIMAFLFKLFNDYRDLITIMWTIGNAIVEPIGQTKSILLIGPGGSGKSTVLKVISKCIPGVTHVIPEYYLTSTNNRIIDLLSVVVASSRLAICYDVDLHKSSLNLSTLKNITGGDTLIVHGSSVHTSCSVFMASNNVPNASTDSELLSTAIQRRLILFDMSVNALELGTMDDNFDLSDCFDFMLLCVYYRIKFLSVPITSRTLVYTLTMDRFHLACERLSFNECSTIHEVDGDTVILILCSILSCDRNTLITNCRLISKSSVFLQNDKYYIKDLSLKDGSSSISGSK
jgi:energy-coupling factor transporter ATP-binding protein EcfA2